MIGMYRLAILLGLLVVITVPFGTSVAHALSDSPPVTITEWRMLWEEKADRAVEEVANMPNESWMTFSQGDSLPEKPEGIKRAWVKLDIPDIDFSRPSLLISKLTAKDVRIYDNNRVVYESKRDYPYNKNEILLPLDSTASNISIYMLLHTDSDWLGIKGDIRIDDYNNLNKRYMNKEVLDVILGTSLLFISLAMYICSFFLNKTHLMGWTSLSTIIMSVGFMVITYSSYLHNIYPQYEFIFFYLFEIGSLLIMPATFVFFEMIFGRGPLGLISYLKRFQLFILCFSLVFIVIKNFVQEVNDIYPMFSMIVFGFSVIVGNSILLFTLITHCVKGNREAIIITTGFGAFCLVGISEITWYFYTGMSYEMYMWKWGILFFIASMIAILTRNIMKNYDQLIIYSNKLEVFNNELQRSEKMEVISQLAASVAHEVRNPLQVTRGFLQLIREKTQNEKEKGFMVLAMDELDRASEIITDFLTFAKPQLDQTELLNLVNEIRQIEAILIPLATMQGASIHVDLTPDLFIKGNSSKFKQALINIIKNSIESLSDAGEVRIKSYKDSDDRVYIIVSDNGEGMEESELKRLGEPYYSKKTKGTGLGLMVTFRIIEIMEGTLQFSSRKGFGTEAIICFNSVENTPTTQ